MSERRLKRSALRDVAGMLRSFDYAARAALSEIPIAGGTPAFQAEDLQPLADAWVAWSSAEFLRGYREASGPAAFLPTDPVERQVLLEAYVVE